MLVIFKPCLADRLCVLRLSKVGVRRGQLLLKIHTLRLGKAVVLLVGLNKGVHLLLVHCLVDDLYLPFVRLDLLLIEVVCRLAYLMEA